MRKKLPFTSNLPFTSHYSLFTAHQKNFESKKKIPIFAFELKKRGRLSPLLFYQSNYLIDNEY